MDTADAASHRLGWPQLPPRQLLLVLPSADVDEHQQRADADAEDEVASPVRKTDGHKTSRDVRRTTTKDRETPGTTIEGGRRRRGTAGGKQHQEWPPDEKYGCIVLTAATHYEDSANSVKHK